MEVWIDRFVAWTERWKRHSQCTHFPKPRQDRRPSAEGEDGWVEYRILQQGGHRKNGLGWRVWIRRDTYIHSGVTLPSSSPPTRVQKNRKDGVEQYFSEGKRDGKIITDFGKRVIQIILLLHLCSNLIYSWCLNLWSCYLNSTTCCPLSNPVPDYFYST